MAWWAYDILGHPNLMSRVLAPVRIAPRRPPAALDPRVGSSAWSLPAAGQPGPVVGRVISVPCGTSATAPGGHAWSIRSR
jgi:hypothetical protein